MPYRNALRDNWQRYQDANDAEMRMYAQERAMSQPQGMYAATEADALSMDDIYMDESGNYVIRGQEPDLGGQMMQMPEMPQGMQQSQAYNPESGGNAIRRRNEELAKALQDY